jgi:hypothetical protein
MGNWPPGSNQSLRQDVANVLDEHARNAEGEAVSEGGALPKTWREAIPYVVWVVIVLGFGLEFVAALVHFELWRAIISFVGLVMTMAAALYSPRLKSWAHRVSPNWVYPGLLVLLTAIIFSPFIEGRQWPLPPISIGAVPSAEEIAASVVKALPKQPMSATPEEIAAAIVHKLPSSSSAPTGPSNDAALDQMRRERDALLQERDALKDALPPKSKWLHLDDARRWQIVKRVTDGMSGASKPCMVAQVLENDGSSDFRKNQEIWTEIQQPLFYAGWRFTQANKTFFPPGYSIVAGAQSGLSHECAVKLKDLLDSLNISPATLHVDETSPDLSACKNECIEIILGRLETP